jgi:hypothetical protein
MMYSVLENCLELLNGLTIEEMVSDGYIDWLDLATSQCTHISKHRAIYCKYA